MTEEEKYARRFNQGYILSKYAPEIADLIPNHNLNSLDLDGLRNGKDEFIHETLQIIEPDLSVGLSKHHDDNDISLDKDDYEPEQD